MKKTKTALAAGNYDLVQYLKEEQPFGAAFLFSVFIVIRKTIIKSLIVKNLS